MSPKCCGLAAAAVSARLLLGRNLSHLHQRVQLQSDGAKGWEVGGVGGERERALM
jgi:hypothetical protein